MTRKLLVSLHDVTPVHADRVTAIVEFLQSRIGSGNFALLMVPNFHGKARVDSDPDFSIKMRHWVDDGCEVFLHGFYHLDRSNPEKRQRDLRARYLTAGEGEFHSIDGQNASTLLHEGRRMVENLIGKPVDGFIAPAWLHGNEADKAIKHSGFDLAEDHFKVWNPQNGKVYARGPVVSYATRSKMRLYSSLAFSRLAVPILPIQKTVRLAIHPSDWQSPAVVSEISRAIEALTRTHNPSRYREIVF